MVTDKSLREDDRSALEIDHMILTIYTKMRLNNNANEYGTIYILSIVLTSITMLIIYYTSLSDGIWDPLVKEQLDI